MLGMIGFKDYRVRCVIGTGVEERKIEQDLLIDLKVETDFSSVSKTENIEDTIDYVILATICREFAQNGKYFLLEKYAADVIQEIVKTFQIKSAWICVKKPLAIPNAEYALVELNYSP